MRLFFAFLFITLVQAGIFPNGLNLQPSYFNNGNVNIGWGLMQQQSKIQTVRIEIEPDMVVQAVSWIAQAKANGYNVIATYHKSAVLGTNDPNELVNAGVWWVENYATLGGGFTINLMNEWGDHTISANDYALAYNVAIRLVRQVNKRVVESHQSQ